MSCREVTEAIMNNFLPKSILLFIRVLVTKRWSFQNEMTSFKSRQIIRYHKKGSQIENEKTADVSKCELFHCKVRTPGRHRNREA